MTTSHSRLNMVPTVPGDDNFDAWSILNFEDRLRSLNVNLTNVMITPELCEQIPGKFAEVKDMFHPSGPVSASFKFQRSPGMWSKQLIIEPQGMLATYRGFPYRLKNVRGRVVHTLSENSSDHIQMDLLADGAGSTISIKGAIKGTHPDNDVDLRIAGQGITLDDELINAMPDDNPELIRKLHATAFGDFVAIIRHNDQVRRQFGPEAYDNQFTIKIRQGAMNYEVFPYPLENMSGTLVVRTLPERPARLPSSTDQTRPMTEESSTTTLEFNDFQATRNGGRLRASGRKDPAPGGCILSLNLDGEEIALDGDLQRALAAIRMENSWKSFEPSGRMNCAVRVKLFSKNDPKATIYPAEDLELAMAFAGGIIKPTFFPYQMQDLAGRVTYAKGRAELSEFRARHGKSEITLPSSEILFRPSGGYWADIRNLRVTPLVIDDPFLAALAPGLRSACTGLELKGAMSLHAARVVIDEQPGPYMPRSLPIAVRGVEPDETMPVNLARPIEPQNFLPTIYWDARLILESASMYTGVDWDNIRGTFATWGLYKGDKLGAVRGNLVFEQATVAKQPVEAVTASLRVDPRQPDVVSIPSIRGKLHGGDIGGEAWVVLDSKVRYAVQLNAARVRLSEVARHFKLPPKAHLEGLANAQIYFANRPDERTGELVLQGGGAIDVPNGKMLNLPVLLNLIKVVKLRVPDDTGFEEAHAMFHIHGDRLKFGQLDLIGNAISLGGEGEMKTDGSDIHFEFYPVWTKFKEMFALPGEWSGAISKRFLKIKVTGDFNGKMDYRAEPVPAIVEPVKRVIKRLK
ncbi:MAG: hypothetical protein K8T89_09665 [Planctomycetes bacterium]|nr:hypothetical protein [Planctomycetota bacterium]